MSKPDSTTLSARDKIKTVEELADIVEALHAEGKKVVLCHGVYDLVHMGHVRHLEQAKKEGDVLIVTTTDDAHVNKGPGRPIFAEALRAEMLAALQYVDWVAINHTQTSEFVLDTIKPDVYVKGSDYENPEDDVTGNIAREREAVEKHGGQMVFTRDITFSSSELINKYLGVYDRPLQDYLNGLRGTSAAQEIIDLIDSVADMRVLLIGDTIIDEYQYVVPMGKSAKESMIATRFKDKEVFAGGVIAAANHVASLCREVEVITVLGNLDSQEEIIRHSLKPNVRLTPLHRDGIPTTRKCRQIDPAYMRKLFEVYYFDDTPPDAAFEASINNLIAERAGDFDLVIVADFGHGMIMPSTIEVMRDKAKFLAVNTQTNSANIGYNLITRYPSADYICIDAPEAQLAVGDRTSELDVVIAEQLADKIDCPKFTVTHGRYGCVAYDREKGTVRIPAFTKTVVDTVGAGDAFLAVTSPLAAVGGNSEHIGFIGNAAGAMKVGILGHRSSVEKVPLMRFITTLLK
ncbi:MAG: adenylyltransferase/cytidyltransferase family protein [Rhodospirillaceae bacterium]|jgi:rfaE bifunctional protein nucleotidyltransferase chain/domain|nr:adenylyltransferase/cytidyltransferase family protein [Rhodospirillaceae bacterium]MBT4219091.1 adenylyltransferase/cytidyltransferase family protein [Rhodospirillaceae bacterium]MBT4464074.1 adenylyltransferase/cytidyltransferase family protein [Rhodospirillaceae bacterium]MBT5309522.1 adenylyltransferase/cytidyltransferase family protein [Rhodospirillaceae bacterium]MBT7355349.1 adenylyltransferase/cytidyltransferase family protein [Rhodospirillaceae bacterium]